MMKPTLIFFCTGGLLYLAWEVPHLLQRKKVAQTSLRTVTEPPRQSAKPVEKIAAPPVPSLPNTQVAVQTSAQPALRSIVPSSGELRSETASDPHSTPPSLLTFSLRLYQKQIEARQSPGKAREYFAELRSCALGEIANVSRNTEAVCLLNAKKLRAEHPWLSADYERLVQRADPATVKLIRGLPI